MRLRTLCVAATLAGCGTAPAPPTVVEHAAPVVGDASGVDAMIAKHVAEGGAVGISAVVVHGGELVVAKGYGRRALGGAPVEADTRFAIGSITKQFTCAVVLLLAEDGELAIDGPVADYYPELARAADIRLLDLMHHTSGYRDYYPLDYVDRRMATPIDPDALLAEYAGGELDFEPRTQWSYSNTGYVLLGRIVERVTGASFGEVLRRRILEPLGMADTAYELEPGDPAAARGYETFALGPPEPNRPEAPGWIGAAGAIWSTAGDLTKWNRAVAAAELLSPESWRIMRTEGVLADGRRTGYGCGISLAKQAGRQVLRHTGAVDGFNAYNAVVPSTGTAVTILANQNGGASGLGQRVLEVLLDPPASVPDVDGPPATDVARELFAAFRRGRVDRARLTPEFDEFLTAARLAGAAERLEPLGEPERIELLSRRERGGMEVTATRLKFADGSALRAGLYRLPDGRIAEFLVRRD